MIQASDVDGSGRVEHPLDSATACRWNDSLEIGIMALKRMDNVGIVVEDLGGTIDFFRELGLELEGRATIEGEWAVLTP